MKIITTKTVSMALLGVLVTACDGKDGRDGVDGADGMDAPVMMDTGSGYDGSAAEAAGLAPLAGGRTAEDIAVATLANSNALTGVASGTPLNIPTAGSDFATAPPSVGADVPVTYFGPAPSSVNPNLIGPYQLLKAGNLDLAASPNTTITLPLYEGRLESGGTNDGASLWYVVTDTSDKENAAALGLNFSAKLRFTDLPDGMLSQTVRRGYYDADGLLVFASGAVDFTPERVVSPGSSDSSGTNNLLASLTFAPGAVGSAGDSDDGLYSPLVQISNAGGHIYNAPMVSFNTSAEQLAPYCDGISAEEEASARALLHDKVVAICPGAAGEPGSVTLALTNGFSFGRPVLYISTDASAEIAASLEGAIYTPALAAIPVGRDDSLFSGVERIFGFTNGPTNDFDEVNPQRQGFNSAIRGEGGPLNVLGGIPTIATDYSPLWDLNLGEWTQAAVDLGYRSRMTEEFAILGMAERGFITGPGGSAYGSTGIIINCPIVHRLL
ncbi:hypothetical protein [Halioxenophilus sp. WMMB6]|uniref:hypothetical protein n=1 Tax=Halioxenophilus sp. WMMB6 TaxID=3073815 RepID=UPI00295E7E48|nr:hypothetical protein [Halioxenophilus sp. WMMB6]